MSNCQNIEAYSAHISVTFGETEPFLGTIYVKGDGNHAVFSWPTQANTKETTELAEFKTQTKWVTSKDGCKKSKFADPDPKFVGMVSHEGYELISAENGKNVYSSNGITCTYNVDELRREVISSIVFDDAKIEFTNVKLAPQDPALFDPPRDCDESD
jgi:hypothetical protein